MERLRLGAAWSTTPVKARRDSDHESGDLDTDLVFRTEVGTAVDYANMRRALRQLTTKAGIEGTWTPRELRHTAVSILSANGVDIETIADIAGHSDSTTTTRVYRHNLSPVITGATGVMDQNSPPTAPGSSPRGASISVWSPRPASCSPTSTTACATAKSGRWPKGPRERVRTQQDA